MKKYLYIDSYSQDKRNEFNSSDFYIKLKTSIRIKTASLVHFQLSYPYTFTNSANENNVNNRLLIRWGNNGDLINNMTPYYIDFDNSFITNLDTFKTVVQSKFDAILGPSQVLIATENSSLSIKFSVINAGKQLYINFNWNGKSNIYKTFGFGRTGLNSIGDYEYITVNELKSNQVIDLLPLRSVFIKIHDKMESNKFISNKIINAHFISPVLQNYVSSISSNSSFDNTINLLEPIEIDELHITLTDSNGNKLNSNSGCVIMIISFNEE